METPSVEEANNLLSNGILVQTSKGLVCMSVHDALSSELNLSVEDLQNLAAQLLLDQDFKKSEFKDRPLISVQSVQAINSSFNLSDGMAESDGFTSESSEMLTLTSAASTSVEDPDNKKNPQTDNNSYENFVPFKVEEEGYFTTDFDSFISSNISDSDTGSVAQTSTPSDESNKPSGGNAVSSGKVEKTTKKRGGWPKGRKRKPELLHLPPKAPSTGYNLYLNEQRLLFKESSLPFHEITKLIGNKWSSLSLDEKKPYLEKAEEEKKRYREELREYRQSGAYQLYLANKRRNRAKYNILSESDMDATDDLDEEDNEELYCRTCDQYFHNLHNKREHLQGRQHMQSVAGAIHSDSYYAALKASSSSSDKPKSDNKSSSEVLDCISQLLVSIGKRENDIKALQKSVKEKNSQSTNLYQQLKALQEKEAALKTHLTNLKDDEKELEQRVFNLWQVPSSFVISNVKDLSC